MKKTIGLAACAILLSVAVVRGDENPFEAFAKFGQPGEEHKKFEPMIGNWTWTSQFWVKPDDKPLDGKGVATRTWVLGGRFMRDVIDSKGGPFGDFSGIGYNGYDKLRGKYTSTWMDSMCTQISPSFGTVDKTGKVFTYDRESIDPATRETVKGRDVIKIISDDEHTMEMYKMMGGKEVKVMAIVFKREKK